MRQKCRWRRRKEARPGEIVEAALELFVERGFSATKIDDVARHAGVSKGTLYLYFESKEALLSAAVREVLLPELERVEQRADSYEGSTGELMRQLAHNWRETVMNERLCGISKLMVAEAGNFPELAAFYVENVVQRTRRLAARMLERGIVRGEFRPLDVDYTARVGLAPIVFAAIFQRSLAAYDDPEYDAGKFLDVHLDIFLRGIAADAADS